MGFRDKFKAAKKRIEVESIKREQREHARLRKRRVKTEAAATRAKLRQREQARIEKARKVLSKGKTGKKRSSMDFGNVFFDTPTKKAGARKKKRKPTKKKSKKSSGKSKGQTITIKVN